VAQRLGEHPLCGLRRAVRGRAGKRAQPDARGHDDDVTAPLREQVRQGGLDRVHGAEPVDLCHLLDVLEGLDRNRLVVRDPGVRDEQVQPARRGDELLDGSGDRRRQRHVAGQRVMRSGQLGGEPLEVARRACGQPDGRAARRQRMGDRAADPARGPGHERAGARSDLHTLRC